MELKNFKTIDELIKKSGADQFPHAPSTEEMISNTELPEVDVKTLPPAFRSGDGWGIPFKVIIYNFKTVRDTIAELINIYDTWLMLSKSKGYGENAMEVENKLVRDLERLGMVYDEITSIQKDII